MGSCFGRCFTKNDSSVRYNRNNDQFSEEHEFNYLVQDEEMSYTEPRSFLSNIFSEKKKKYKPRKKPVLELVEDLWTSGSSYSRLKKSTRKSNTSLTGRNDIPLQCLDVRALLIKSTEPPTSSTPASSLDLEWEHEHLPATLQDSLLSSWTMVPEEDRTMQSSEASPFSKAPMDAADSDWSRVPSADSLEWDPVQSPLHCSPDLDIDTQQLLTEIEQLTERALRETGSGLTS